MSTTNEYNAGAPLAGYVYQIYYFLYRLLTIREGEIVSMEKIDDVGTEGEGMRTYYQLKHSIENGKRISNRDNDLWKTLSMWVDIIKGQGDEDVQKRWIEESDFVLLSNKTAENNLFVILLNDYNNNDKEWEKLKAHINEMAQKRPKEKREGDDRKNIFYYTKNVNDYPLLQDFLKKVYVEMETDDEIKRKIDYVLTQQKYVPKGHAVSLRNIIMGTLIDQIKEKETQYTDHTFNTAFGSLIHDMQTRKFVPVIRKYPLPERPFEQTFVKQLGGVGDPRSKAIASVANMTNQKLCFENDYNDANMAAGKETQKTFEADVWSRWDDAFTRHNSGLTVLSSIADIMKAGMNVLNELKRQDLKYGNDELGRFESNGCFYHFSDGDSPRIGWRYDWKELYHGKEWTIE